MIINTKDPKKVEKEKYFIKNLFENLKIINDKNEEEIEYNKDKKLFCLEENYYLFLLMILNYLFKIKDLYHNRMINIILPYLYRFFVSFLKIYLFSFYISRILFKKT